MNKQVNIDFDVKSGRFIINLPMWANDALNGIDPKRWNKAKRAWVAVATRRNVEEIEKLRTTADITPDAEEAIKAANNRAAQPTAGPGTGLPVWYKFKTTPRDHQLRAYKKLYGLNAAGVHMDMGTGKSKMAIDIGCALRMEGKIDAMVVVCKVTLRRNWVGYDLGDGPGMKEGFLGHAPIPCDLLIPDTSKPKVFEKWLHQPHDFPVLVVGTESLSSGGMFKIVEKFMTTHGKVFMLIDESHMISNHKAVRSERCVELGRMAEYRATLTGTPTSTGPLNLFMQFEFLDSDIIGIGDFYAFRNRYAVMGGYRDPRTGKPMQVVGYQNIEELTKLVAPHIFECRKDEVLDLPPKVFERRYVKLTDEQKSLYKQIKGEDAYIWDGTETAVQNALETALRLHQVAGGFITTQREEKRLTRDGSTRIKKISDWHAIIPSERNPKVQEVLDIATAGKPMIVWCAYKSEIEAVCVALRSEYPGELVREIHGGISDSDRDTHKNEFQAGKCRFLVSNTATGGTGLTLTAAEIVVYYSNTNHVIDRTQSEDRAHRDGLRHSVLYIDIIAEGTIDEAIIRSNSAKIDLSEYIRSSIRKASDLNDLMGEG